MIKHILYINFSDLLMIISLNGNNFPHFLEIYLGH